VGGWVLNGERLFVFVKFFTLQCFWAQSAVPRLFCHYFLHLKFNIMENNQPTNKIDSITQFLTVHNTTVIAVIMAISALLGQNYEQTEEDVHEKQEDFEDRQADLESIKLMYGENSPKYLNAANEYWEEEEELLKDAMETIDYDDPSVEIPKAEGRLPQQTEDGYVPQTEGDIPQPQENAQQAEGEAQQPQGEMQPTEGDVQQQPEAAMQQQPTQNAEHMAEDKMEEVFDEVVEEAETQSMYSDYATTILQISVLLSSIGVSSMNKLLTYLASGLTLLGVILEIAAAVM